MKVYRTIPDSFYIQSINAIKNDKRIFEDVYYRMGYISFGQHANHSYNTIYKKLSDKERCGKYFFLFIDDAVRNGLSLLNSFHSIYHNNTFIILEYEVPDDLVLKHIGNGDYTSDAFKNYVMECFITKDDLDNGKSASIRISNEKKEKGLTSAFENSLKTIVDYADAAYFEYKFYQEFFNVDDLSKIIHKPNLLASRLIISPFYDAYMNTSSKIIQTSFITGKSIYVNDFVDDYHQLIDKLEPREKRFKDSNDQHHFKQELLYYSRQDTVEAKEKIKTLLKERSFME